MVRRAVEELRRMGPLPSEKESIENPSTLLEKYQQLLLSIEKPVTDDEADILAGVFGVDDCFGLAWTLVHLIETAHKWSAENYSGNADDEWVKRLRDREKGWRGAGYPARSFYKESGLPDPRSTHDPKGSAHTPSNS
jgi:hypothetical protein